MTGRHLGPKSAVAALEELFLGDGASRDGRVREGITLVLIDELDLLLTRKQKVRRPECSSKWSEAVAETHLACKLKAGWVWCSTRQPCVMPDAGCNSMAPGVLPMPACHVSRLIRHMHMCIS